MRRTNVPAYFGPFLLVTSLLAFPPLPALAQASGASVAVKMIDAIDSARDPAGKQYRAAVTNTVNAGNGITIPQGAVAAVALIDSGNGSWTTHLVSITLNGQPVAVSSGSASVTGAAQSVAGHAANSLNSALGRFGHRVSEPAAAMAMGQRVVLPPGTTLTFVLSQPPAVNAASPVAVASAPSASQPSPSSSAPVATAGQNWWICQYNDAKDPNKPAAGSRMYYAVLPADAAFQNDVGWKHFNAYVQQNYTITDPNSAGKGFCRRSSNDAAARANSRDMFLKQWRASNIEAIEVGYADTPAQNAAIDAKLASSGSAAPPASKPPSSNPNAAKCAALIAQGQKPPPYCSN